MPVKAILFDLEGTIIDTEKLWDECAVEFLGRHGHTYDKSATKHLMMGRTLEQGAVILREHHGFTGNPRELAQERREIFGQLLSKDVAFIPGFEAFFDSLGGTYKVAIATLSVSSLTTSIPSQTSALSLNHIPIFSCTRPRSSAPHPKTASSLKTPPTAY
jgi:beta-phosphoglucomutase-like phosphatase (HAD superfamily)